MEIIIQLVLLAFGFLMLVKGADWFVEGAAGIAEKFGIPQLVVGLTIVAMGTSAPEAAVSITAAMKENADITVGNVVGSNILNVLIILGITSVIVTIAVAKSTVKIEIPYMILITLLFMGLGFTGGEITFWEGMILWAAFLLYLGYLFWMAMNTGGGRNSSCMETAYSDGRRIAFSCVWKRCDSRRCNSHCKGGWCKSEIYRSYNRCSWYFPSGAGHIGFCCSKRQSGYCNWKYCRK